MVEIKDRLVYIETRLSADQVVNCESGETVLIMSDKAATCSDQILTFCACWLLNHSAVLFPITYDGCMFLQLLFSDRDNQGSCAVWNFMKTDFGFRPHLKEAKNDLNFFFDSRFLYVHTH